MRKVLRKSFNTFKHCLFKHSPYPHSNCVMGVFTSVLYLPKSVRSMPLVHNKKPHGKGISGALNVDMEANKNPPRETPARTEGWKGTIIRWERKRGVLSICKLKREILLSHGNEIQLKSAKSRGLHYSVSTGHD